MIDNLIAGAGSAWVKTLYDPVAAVARGIWRVVRNRATLSATSASRTLSGGGECPALKLEFAYWRRDASVEYWQCARGTRRRWLPVGMAMANLFIAATRTGRCVALGRERSWIGPVPENPLRTHAATTAVTCGDAGQISP